MCIMTEEGSTKIVNFITPGAWVLVLGPGHISHIAKMLISLTIFLSTHVPPGIDQTNQACSNDEQERVYQNCKFHTSHYSEYV